MSGRASGLGRLFAQHLDVELPLPLSSDPVAYARTIYRVRELIDAAAVVVVGAGSGLSAAAGLDFYHGDEGFLAHFEAFARTCGVGSVMDGTYHAYGSNEERWGFLAQLALYLEAVEVGEAYRDLAGILCGREHFVVTSNVDGLLSREGLFDQGRVCYFQGDLRFLQCCQPCCDRLVTFSERAHEMVARMEGMRCRPEDLPRCEECGWLMAPWVRDRAFLEGAAWRAQVARYEAFLERHLVERGERVLFLELGVSGMTPGVIKLPFQSMAARNDNAFYVSVNRAKESVPALVGERGITVTGDIARVLHDLRAL